MLNSDFGLQFVPDGAPKNLNTLQKTGAVLASLGFLFLLTIALGNTPSLIGWLGFTFMAVGGCVYAYGLSKHHAGVNNHGVMVGSFTGRGLGGWMLGIFLTGFYVLLYFYPNTLRNLIVLVDPIKIALSGSSAIAADVSLSQWFFYGFCYTVAVVVMGVRALVKYRYSKYQVLRTLSVMFFQLAFAFIIPNIMLALNQPYFEWTNIWPLRYYELWPGEVSNLKNGGTIGMLMLFWGILSFLVLTPILTYFYGKRWYCSWVCGCGGLAETLGDPFRQNSSKTLQSWKWERWIIHGVLLLIGITTAVLWLNHLYGFLGNFSGKLAKFYGFAIGAMFSGVIGTGFYPIFGSRVWCRFGCPMAAYLGIFQRFFSRFRITTNGGQCISCGNCSTYCEMGIDVRAYAQKGQNIVRASCVGCGMCSTVCPRGVLNLENGPREGRMV